MPVVSSIHAIHMSHHREHYPVSRLLRKAPYISGGGARAFAPLVLATMAGLFLVLPLRIFMVIALEATAFIMASDYLHTQ